nr:hypothetical protein [Tanacetum cinerariifolium]
SIVDEVVNEEMDDNLERATTTATSLDAEQNKGVNTPRSGEDSLEHIELIKICTTLQKKVLDLEDELKRTKIAQQTKIDGLERRVKKLEKNSSNDDGLGEEDASKHRRIIHNLDADEDITLVNDEEMFDADKDLQGEEVVVEQEVVADKEPIVDVVQVSAAATTVTTDGITLAKALEDLKTLNPKIRGIVMKDHEEPSESRRTTSSSKRSQDKGKAKMIEEHLKLKKKDQILFVEEVARKLQEEINEKERLIRERAKQKEEANIALIETWEDIQ